MKRNNNIMYLDIIAFLNLNNGQAIHRPTVNKNLVKYSIL